MLLALGAVLTALAYPPLGASPLALVMLAPVVAAIDSRRPLAAFGLVWLYSVTMALFLVRWLVGALVNEYGVAAAPAWTVTCSIVFGCALVPALAGALYAALRPRLSDVIAPLAFAALWISGEWLRASLLGVPWLLLAQALWDVPIAIQAADLGGTHAVGLVIAAVNAGIGTAARRRGARPLLVPAALAVLAALYGVWRLGELPSARPELRVGIVQASLPPGQRFQPGSALRNTARHAELSRQLLAEGAVDVVVWSETAVDTDLDENPALVRSLADLTDELGVPIVTGAPRSTAGERTNSVVLFAPGNGLAESYAKQRLVPFSEYDPPLGAWLTPLLGPVIAGSPYTPGAEPTVFRGAALPLAAPICFEITYPDLARGFRAAGAEVLVNLSNDAWFGRSGYAEMHLAHAVFRAVELRTWVVRGANTGISAIVDPAGRIEIELPIFEEGVLRGRIGAAESEPLYARAGNLPVLTVLLLVMVLSCWDARRRPAQPPAAGPAGGPGRDPR